MNKKGFTFIEVILATLIIFIAGVSSLGFYNNYTNQLDDTTQYIQMKINATKSYGLAMSDLLYTIDGVKSRPYIKFTENKMTIVTGQGQNLSTSVIPYTKIHENLINVTTTVNGNTIYFNNNGLAIDKDGNLLPRIHIYITKKIGNSEQTETITIDCLGNITTTKMKDISSTACSVSAPVEDPISKKNRQECPSGFNYNPSLGACEVICNKAGYESVNGNCAKKCPANATHPYEKLDTCVCNTGYEPWNGQCVKKCQETEIRNNNGVCTDSTQAFPAGEVIDVTNLPKNLKAIRFKIWGAGGGFGGNDQSPGGNGAGGGYVEGEISAVYTDKVQILIGSAGNNGITSEQNQTGKGAAPGRYGGGGAGGSTGHEGASGSGGSGGGASWLAINGTYVAIAGGGGGGGGGSYNTIGLNAGTCFTVSSNTEALKGKTSPRDGGGGGGGGGSEPLGGVGGGYGLDQKYGGIHAGGGCNGINKLSSNVKSPMSYTSSNYLPANPDHPQRNGAGKGGQNSGFVPATNGLVLITYVTGESGNEV